MTTLPATKHDLLSGIKAIATRPSTSGGGKPFLRLAKHGDWSYGADESEIDMDAKFAVNPYSIRKGYIAWGDGEVQGEQMVPVGAPDVDPHSLPAHDWKYQLGFDLAGTTGATKGQEMSYSTTSQGGLRAITKLLNEIGERIEADTDHIVPVITLSVDSYTHKKYGKIFTPVLTVVDWVTMDDEVYEEDHDDDEPEAAPPKRVRNRLRA